MTHINVINYNIIIFCCIYSLFFTTLVYMTRSKQFFELALLKIAALARYMHMIIKLIYLIRNNLMIQVFSLTRLLLGCIRMKLKICGQFCICFLYHKHMIGTMIAGKFLLLRHSFVVHIIYVV